MKLLFVLMISPMLFAQSLEVTSGSGSFDAGNFIGGYVLRVNAEAITSNEVIEMLNELLASELDQTVNTKTREVAQKEIVKEVMQFTISRIQELLLYQHAYNELNKGGKLDDQLEKEAQKYRKDFLKRLDKNNAVALKKLKELNIDLDEKSERHIQGILIDSYRQSTRSEAGVTTRFKLYQYYRKHLEDQYTDHDSLQFQLCDMPFGDNKKGVRKKAHAAQTALDGGVTFDKVVQQYSQGFRKSYDGIWRPLDPTALQPLYQPIVKALDGQTVGYVSGIIESENHLFIAKLLSRTYASVKKFKNAQYEIRQRFEKKAWESYQAKTAKILYEEASISERALQSFAQRTTLEIYSRYKKK